MSTRRIFQQSSGKEPGTWRLWALGSRVRVIVVCPTCSMESTLVHEVRTNGDVEPSMQCPHNGCAFHEFGALEDWPGLHLALTT